MKCMKCQKHKSRYPRNATVAKHSPPEAPKKEIRTTQMHRELQQKNSLKRSVGKLQWGLNQFYLPETLPFVQMQLQITNICSVCIGILYPVSQNCLMKQNKGLCGILKPKHNYKQDHNEPSHRL